MSVLNHTALVLEGGGFRGMFTAGVLEVMLREQLLFDYLIGVSAGAAYGVSYVSRQQGRNFAVNQYVGDSRYCGWTNLVKQGSYFNWQFVYHTLPTQLLPFDYEAFNHSSSRIKVVVSNIVTGQPEYHWINGSDPDRFRDWLTATSSLPIISKYKVIDDKRYMDGGLADSIPVMHALNDGNRRAVVVLTRDRAYRKTPMKNSRTLRWFYRKHPHVVDLMMNRAQQYNHTLDVLDELEQKGQVFVIRPAKPIAVSRLENNPDGLAKVYHNAMMHMEEELPRLREWLGC